VEQIQLATATDLATKQDTLVSGTNIKTVNNQSLLGSGNISISSGVTSYNDLTDKPIYDASYVEFAEGSTITNEQYQELKDATINQNILNLNGKAATGYYNFGDIRIECTSGNQYSRFTVSKTDNNHTVSLSEIDLGYDSDILDLYDTKQDLLVSGTNIKTINNQSILGSGNLDILNMVYPVGSIYMSVNSTSPATLFGGTWQQIEDTFLLSAGSTYTAGDTGGEATHTLTTDEMPSHDHNTNGSYLNNGAGGSTATWLSWGAGSAKVQATGGGQAHNNMPPYLVVYMWERTA
jgi:hypothetical protein